jgi:hypothetical protein
MNQRVLRAIPLAGLIAAGCFSNVPAWATAIAHSNLGFSGVGITPSAGTVEFTGPWTLQAQASADNSLSEFDSGFDEKTGPDTASASAAVTWASSSGAATDPAPTPPFLDISGASAADANIPGAITASAQALGRGTARLDDPFAPTYFQITGGTGTVDVTFSVLIDYAISVTTDQFGVLAEAEAIFGQALFGDDVGFVLVNSFNNLLSIGPNDHQEAQDSLSLSNTLTLSYGTTYSLLLEADAEVRVYNAPEPAPLWLMALAAPLVLRYVRRVRI